MVVLASASPARRATLVAAGIDPLVRVSDVDEDAVVARHRVSAPEDIALVLARAKAEDVAARLGGAGDPDAVDALVVGCDSVLELDGEVHGKPGTPERAVERWRRMRGRSGVLHTGHWLVDGRDPDRAGTGATLGAVASTTVHFADLADDEIDAYVATGEPLDVAGAFTVDGLGGAYVLGVEGDHHAVVGISLPLLRELLGGAGLRWHTLWRRPG
ncbi:MAG TPA: nucleoside triphosphate pyrophosphatase [Kineosporiaceae bacterium]|nr:nucleoside triphosphate pyrophosphatase [Kineosporiaceae bacterium]